MGEVSNQREERMQTKNEEDTEPRKGICTKQDRNVKGTREMRRKKDREW